MGAGMSKAGLSKKEKLVHRSDNACMRKERMLNNILVWLIHTKDVLGRLIHTQVVASDAIGYKPLTRYATLYEV